MQIVKRNGTLQDFDPNKIKSAMLKAFNSCCPTEDTEVIDSMISEMHLWDGITIEEIEEIIIETLIDFGYDEVALAYYKYKGHRQAIRNKVQEKLNFIEQFKNSDNTANATIDDNSNVATHNIAVLNSEMHKPDNQEINMRMLRDKLHELYPDFDYKQMDIDFSTIGYLHDASSQVGMPYCVAITLYPFLNDGIKNLGGLSVSPKNIDSFCGMFVNLVFAIASQFKGAVATPGVLLVMDYFIRKEWGNDYYKKVDAVITSEHCLRQQTIQGQIHQYFQQICYSLMQPSGSRGNQACFWNLSIFDRPFFDTMYGDFYFPDGSQPQWESLEWLQKDFMHWFNQERLKCVLTFPVVSLCLINQEGKFLDEGLADFACQEYAEGNSFFTYISDSADSLSSCCRLSSKLEKPQFNFTNGQLSEMTGSKNVITLNFNRLIQDWAQSYYESMDFMDSADLHIFYAPNSGFKPYLENVLERIYKYQLAYNACLEDLYKANLLTVYNAGFIDMKKQYLTIGINGLNQAFEYLGGKCNKNEEYEKFCNLIFTTIKEANKAHSNKEIKFNTEFTPCESAAVKLYNRDKAAGYWVPEDTNLYASYIYKPNDSEISVLDKLYLHGRNFCGDNLDGGSSAHINLDSHLSKEQYRLLLNYAAEVGCKYFTFNIPNCECENCGFIAKQPFNPCPKCGSDNVSLWDRVIGYLTKIKNWAKGRQIEQKTRVYGKIKENIQY